MSGCGKINNLKYTSQVKSTVAISSVLVESTNGLFSNSLGTSVYKKAPSTWERINKNKAAGVNSTTNELIIYFLENDLWVNISQNSHTPIQVRAFSLDNKAMKKINPDKNNL